MGNDRDRRHQGDRQQNQSHRDEWNRNSGQNDRGQGAGQHHDDRHQGGESSGYGGQYGSDAGQSMHGWDADNERRGQGFGGMGFGGDGYGAPRFGSREGNQGFGQRENFGRREGFGYDSESQRNQSGYGTYQRGQQGHQGNRSHDDRGFIERAGDEVASWFGDDGAERRREADHRGKGPRGYSRSDDRIRDDVNDKLSDDSHIDASDIEVAVQGGEVTLTGQVSSRFERRHAEDCAERISGVSYVQNNLRVKSSMSGSREGEGIGAITTNPGTSSGSTGTFGSDTKTSGKTDV